MKNNKSNNAHLHKYLSKNLQDKNIGYFIENEKTINEYLIKENEKIKETNLEIQNELLQYIQDNTPKDEDSSCTDIEKYNHVLVTVKEHMKKLKTVDEQMLKETYLLFQEFFTYIKEVIIKQHQLCYTIKEDMHQFRSHVKEDEFRRNILEMRKLCEHNSILRAQIELFNKFKLKNENLIHADFEQLELKYKNLNLKEVNLQNKIDSLNKKIKKFIEKKLHYDEKNLYLEKLLEEKNAKLEETNLEIKKKKKLLSDLKKKKEETLKKCNESEANIITRNVFETFQKKKIYFENLKKMLKNLQKEYEHLSR